ncbi:uncharacterized protein LOC135703448 [Ochlerotatus camptorhynchus]|uniref:uncharacterized protein LOC135703448 n=1 Tax=Ochlerotatus camptorhynchus TaxID=644619 RepID=UPI0031DA1B70
MISPRFASISDYEEVMQFNVLPKLTIPLPSEEVEISQWNLPEDMVSSVPKTSTTLCSMTELQEQLTRFWELESCHVKSTYSVEESTCEEIFKQTTVRDDDGRFVVSLPKKEHIIERLGDSRRSAEKRFASLEKRFVTNPQLKELYCEFMEEYLSMGHMKKVREEDLSESACYFLPHHAVLKPDSTTTKLRVVFDASCKTTSGFSLNDGLMVGPVVQDDLG